MLNLSTFVLLILIPFSVQDKNCLVNFERCDFIKKMKPDTIPHCKYSYFDRNEEEYCGDCEDDFYSSNDRKSCLHVEIKIEHCLKYYLNDDRMACSLCEDDYVISLNGENCLEFKNCEYLGDNEDECGRCKVDYARSYDKKSCIYSKYCKRLAEGDKKCSSCYELYHQNSEGQCELTQCEDYDDNDVCIKCYEGYYLDDNKKCQKITIENCLELDENKKKCSKCLFDITPDTNGNCILPSTLIKGCIQYGTDGKCITCSGFLYENELTSNGACNFTGCQKYQYKGEYCGMCKAGYDYEKDYNICIGYDGSMDVPSSDIDETGNGSMDISPDSFGNELSSDSSDSSFRGEVQYILLILIFALLI